MKLHELKAAPGSRKSKQRVGRGMGSGSGKTSGRGQKGQASRAGGTKGAGFEGGQTPIHMRLPKRGFNNAVFRKKYGIVNVGDLDIFAAGSTVAPEDLIKAGLVKPAQNGIKILGDGDLNVSLTVRAHQFTAGAARKIESAGGKAEVI